MRERPGLLGARPALRAVVVAFAAAAVMAGCSAPEPRTEEARTARAQVLIEDGNAAYRQGDYRLAVRRYAAATVVNKKDAAAYYGMGMALSKLGRDEEARVAYARARELAASAAAGGAAGGRARGPGAGKAPASGTRDHP